MSDSKSATAMLQAILDALTAYDIDAIMSFFRRTVFDTPRDIVKRSP